MTITRISASGTFRNGASSISITSPCNLSAGNVLIIGVGEYSTLPDIPSATQVSKSGTATLGAFSLDESMMYSFNANEKLYVKSYSAQITGSGTCTIMVSASSTVFTGNAWNIGIAEYHSTAGSITLVAHTSASASTGAATTPSGSCANGAVFIGVANFASSGNITITPDASFTTIYEDEKGSSDLTASIIDRIVSTGTTGSAKWTAPTNLAWPAILAIYQEASSGGGGSQIVSGCASLSGLGGDIPNPLLKLLVLMSLSGQGNVIPNSILNNLGISSLAGLGNITPSSLVTTLGTSSFGGTGNINPNIQLLVNALGSLVGKGDLSPQAYLTLIANLVLGGKADISGIPVLTINGLSTLSGLGDLLGSATVGGLANTITGSAILDAYGNLNPNVISIVIAQLNALGIGGLDAQSLVTVNGLSSLAGLAFLIASGVIGSVANVIEGQSILAGRGDLILSALQIIMGEAIITGEAKLAAQALLQILLDAILTGTGNYQANAILLLNAIASLYGAGVLQPIATIQTSLLDITPSSRIFVIQGENRILVIDSEGRIFVITSDGKNIISSESRILVVDSEDRTFKI